MYAETIIASLESAPDKEVKAFLISQLQLAGGVESIGALSKYLADDRLCDPAARALVTIGSASAKDALRKALTSAQGPRLVTIIKALGTLRCKKAIKEIMKHTSSEDANVRRTALWAAANIGDKSADKVLAKAVEKTTGFEKAKAASLYLLYAQRQAEDGRKRQCAKICRAMIKNRKADVPENVQCAALSTLVSAYGKNALNDLLDAMDSKSVELQAAALGLAGSIEGTPATKKWVKKTKKVAASVRVRILGMLARRGDKYALPTILQYLEDEDKLTRIAAIGASIRLGGDEAVDEVLALLQKTKDSAEIEAAKQALVRLEGEAVLSAVAEALPQMPAGSKIALIDLLAMRTAVGHVDAVLEQTGGEDASVRLAAIKALDDLTGPKDLPKLVELLLEAKTNPERSAAQKAVVKVARQIPNAEERAELLLSALEKVDRDKKPYLLSALGRIGGSKALAAVLAEMKSTNEDVKDAAIRALTNWPDGEAIPELLDVITNTKTLTHKVLAVRGFVRLMVAADLPARKKAVMFKKALGAVERAEEKRQLLTGLGNVRTAESLGIVQAYLDDETVRTDAALATAKIACPIDDNDKGLTDYKVARVLKKAIEFIKNDRVRKRVQRHIDSIPVPQAKQKPVPEGFVALFNGKDLTGWKGLLDPPYDNPIKRAKLSDEQLTKRQAQADEKMRRHWHVVNGVLYFDGGGFSLATVREYGDFEMLVDWKLMGDNGDSGIYLRGSPQVQIWDPVRWKIGSGGLYNNKKNPSKPTIIADNPIGQWNTFRIRMTGDKVTVHLNDKLVVDNVTLENYWDRNLPIFPREQIELQCHGDPIHFSNIFIRQISRKAEWVSLFNGKDLTGWTGAVNGYGVEDGSIYCKAESGGNLYTTEEFGDFHLKFEFKLTAGANNGLGIRTPLNVNAAYQGMEIQILDNSADKWAKLKAYQYHGSIYGVKPAKRGYLKPVGQWNSEEVIAKGKNIKVILNGETIVEADEAYIDKAIKEGTIDGQKHPGLKRLKGHIGFLGHGSRIDIRNIRIMELE
jgi:HEAT repeat protein